MKKLFLLLSLIVVFSCDPVKTTVFEPVEITPILISKGDYINGNYNPTRHNEIFTNASDWNNFVTNGWAISSPPNEAFTVNFDEHQVIAAFDKTQPTDGYSIDITSVTEYEDNIVIVVEQLNIGGIIDTPSRPYHIIKIPVSDKPIIFE